MENPLTESEEKELVEEYIAQHNIQNVLNKALNKIVKHRPEDPYASLSDLLAKESNGFEGIISINMQQFLDGDGKPSIQIRVTTNKGVSEAMVSNRIPGIYDQKLPSPANDTDNNTKENITKENNPDEAGNDDIKSYELYGGKSMENSIKEMSDIIQSAFEGIDPSDQESIDSIIYGMIDKIGENVALALSIALCKAGAKHMNRDIYEHIAVLSDNPLENTSIPVPMVSLINGGMHASNELFIRDILVLPLDSESFADALKATAEVKILLQESLTAGGFGYLNIGAMGGIALQVDSPEEILSLIKDTIHEYESDNNIKLGIVLDIGANDFHVPLEEGDESGIHLYNINLWSEGKESIKTSEDLLGVYQSWKENFSVMTIIDPFYSDDLKSFGNYNNIIQQSCKDNENAKNVGGDSSCYLQLVAENSISNGINKLNQENACNTVVISPYAFKTVTEGIKKIAEIRSTGMSIIVGTIPGSTETDSFLVDFAVGLNAGQVKFGGTSFLQGTIKYNRLLELSRYELPYVGKDFRR